MKNRGQRSWSVGLSIADITNSVLTDKRKTHSVSTLAQVQPQRVSCYNKLYTLKDTFKNVKLMPGITKTTNWVFSLIYKLLSCYNLFSVYCRAGVALVQRCSLACRASWEQRAPHVTLECHWDRRRTRNWGTVSHPFLTSWVSSRCKEPDCTFSLGLTDDD